MTPEEQIIELKQRLEHLETLFRFHKHLGYDESKSLPSTSSAAAGSDTEIQFNNGGNFAGSPRLFFLTSPSPDTLVIGVENTTAYIQGADSVTATKPGTSLQINAGIGATTGAGGKLSLLGGDVDGSANANGGNLDLSGGFGNGTGHDGDVTLNNGSAIATTATGKFLVIPFCAGTPTGTPTNTTGSIVYDSSNNKLYCYNGGWKSVTLA